MDSAIYLVVINVSNSIALMVAIAETMDLLVVVMLPNHGMVDLVVNSNVNSTSIVLVFHAFIISETKKVNYVNVLDQHL